MNHRRFAPFLTLLLVALAGIVSAVTPEMQRKSRYFSTAAMQAAADNKPDESLELYRRAYSIDPGNLAAGYALAVGTLPMLDSEDTIQLDRVLSLMREYVDAYPADSDEGQYYSYLCAMLGDWPEALRITSRIYDLYPKKTELLPTMAEYRLQLSEPDSALMLLDMFEQLEGSSPQLYLRKGLIHLAKNDTAGALAQADAMITNTPASAEGYLIKSSMLRYLGYQDSVPVYLDKAEKVEPSNGAVKLAKVEYFESQGDSAALINTVFQALMLDDIDLDNKLQLLTTVIAPTLNGADTNTALADTLFHELLNQYPHDPSIRDYASGYAAAHGDFAEAADQIAYAVDLDPDNASYLIRQLAYLIAANKTTSALKAYEKIPATTLDSDPRLLYYGTAIYGMLKRDDDALATARRMLKAAAPSLAESDSVSQLDVLQLSKENRKYAADAFSVMGDTYYKMKKHTEAYHCYDNALMCSPDDAGVLNNYAYYLCETGGNLDKALEMSKKANEVDTGNTIYLDTLAWIYFRQGDYEKALEIQQQVIDNMSPEDNAAEYYDHYGDILYKNGQTDKALEMWQKALEQEPDNNLIRRKVTNKTYYNE